MNKEIFTISTKQENVNSYAGFLTSTSYLIWHYRLFTLWNLVKL